MRESKDFFVFGCTVALRFSDLADLQKLNVCMVNGSTTVYVTKNRRGIPVEQKKEEKKVLRFCDVATTHTMRRTAVTTMLSLVVPEQVVRKISGHSASGKEFYRYVSPGANLPGPGNGKNV